jgi:hypothetical protein
MARGVAAASERARPRPDARGPGPHAVDRIRDLIRNSFASAASYSPVKFGSRFSMNAIIASAVSRDENINDCAMPSDSIACAIV